MDGDNLEQLDLKFVAQFGVGCVQFRPKETSQIFSSFDNFIDSLKDSLGQIAAIKDVTIESDSSMGNFDDEIESPFPLLADGDFPLFSGQFGVTLEIKLRLSIPDRTQRSILEIKNKNWRPFGDILIFISHEYTLPIIIVYLDSLDDVSDASSCVVLVRKFLESEMNNNKNCKFSLDYLGPTPFHANFIMYIKGGEDFKWNHLKRSGYDKISLLIGEKFDISDIPDVVSGSGLLSNFDTFYFIKILQNSLIESWYSCLEQVADYESERRGWSKWKLFLDALFPRINTHDIFSNISQFGIDEINKKSQIRNRIMDENDIELGPIWFFLRKEKKRLPKFDIEYLENFVGYIERKQTKNQNIFSIIISALVAAVIGALVAKIF